MKGSGPYTELFTPKRCGQNGPVARDWLIEWLHYGTLREDHGTPDWNSKELSHFEPLLCSLSTGFIEHRVSKPKTPPLTFRPRSEAYTLARRPGFHRPEWAGGRDVFPLGTWVGGLNNLSGVFLFFFLLLLCFPSFSSSDSRNIAGYRLVLGRTPARNPRKGAIIAD